jgi:hypothetical protein
MRVCIHRGAHEIGGTCIEIEAQHKRIVLDIGLPPWNPNQPMSLYHPSQALQSLILPSSGYSYHTCTWIITDLHQGGVPVLIGSATQDPFRSDRGN